MFEKTQKAATDLSAAVTEDANNAVIMAKAMIIPAFANFFGNISVYTANVKSGIEDGSLFKRAEEAVADEAKTTADPLPSAEQNEAIRVLRALNKSDEEIAATVGVSVLTVKMSV